MCSGWTPAPEPTWNVSETASYSPDTGPHRVDSQATSAALGSISDADLESYANLIVKVGLHLRSEQDLLIEAEPEHASLVRAVAEAAYRSGAHHVSVLYRDPHLIRAHIEHGPVGSLGWCPPWMLEQIRYLAQGQGAYVRIAGDPQPGLMDDLDGNLVGGAVLRERLALVYQEILVKRSISWVIAPWPTGGWASKVLDQANPAMLWEDIRLALRLDQQDPSAAWTRRVEELERRATELTRLAFNWLHFQGPGTDLKVGLIPGGRWSTAMRPTSWGQPNLVNIPTEEVFTSPDWRLVDGTVRATRPLALHSTIVEGLEVRFSGGRAVEVRARSGADVVLTEMSTDEQASYLGEVSLVDGDSRVARLGRVYYETILDENASCHVAYGSGFDEALPEPVDGAEQLQARGVNQSTVHRDFMIGGPEVEVDGVYDSGRRVEILRSNRWCLD